VNQGQLYIGGVVDVETGDRTGEPLEIESAALTTHGVIVGMTGSGKTGLGVGLLEEALSQQIPCLILDPKGDMGNLLLNFPSFRGEDFRPWIDESLASREGITPDELAERTARTWEEGLASWDLGPDQMRVLGTAADFIIYTPGSSSGVPINIVGSLAAPPEPFSDDPETYRDEIGGFVASLLEMAGVTADPVSSPEHILLATIIEDAWSQGRSLDLTSLIAAVQSPPFRKLGVFDLDTFFPPEKRTDLALRLNGLVASPAFSSWMEGPPLDIETLLMRDGKPQAAIIYLAHLSDPERQFVVTLLLSKLITWMRRQSGTSELRALMYMDEVYGFCPPTAQPPSKKPMLTLLKQARAYGVGIVLATQNPVDLDYKAMSNAGTWMVGRLQTERDKARILEGITSATGHVDVAAFDRIISGLGKRQFVLQEAGSSAPRLFGTRWVMSYLAGPLTRDHVRDLTGERRSNPAESVLGPDSGTLTAVGTSEVPRDVTPVAPAAATDIPVNYLDPAAPWSSEIGADPTGRILEAAAVATVSLRYDDRSADLDHTEEYEVVISPLTEPFDVSVLHQVDHDDRDFRSDPPDGVVGYRIPEVKLGDSGYWSSLASELKAHLQSVGEFTLFSNPELKLWSRPGESREAFLARCRTEADDAADAELAKLKDTYATRISRVEDRLAAAERRAAEIEVDLRGKRTQELVSGAGDLLGMLLGGRKSATGLRRAASRRSQSRSTKQRLETAQAKIDDAADELVSLEDELEEAVLEITGRYEKIASRIDEVAFGLESDDVKVAPLRMVWFRV